MKIEFNTVIKNVSETTNHKVRQKIVDEFIRSKVKEVFPIFETKEDVLFIYKGDGNPSIIGDMTNWERAIPYESINGTDLKFLRLRLDENARLEYGIILDDPELISPDPFNLFVIWNGFGPHSELAMPGYKRNPIFNDYLYGEKGEIQGLIELKSPKGALPYPHQVHVYLPPDYKGANRSYHSVYFQDGLDYVEFAVVPHLITELIILGEIEPLVAVFVTPPNRYLQDMPNRLTEYGLNDNYVHFFTRELVPMIEKRFRVKNEPEKRLVVGDSFGGLISLYIAFKESNVFRLVYSQSGYHSFKDGQLINLFEQSPAKLIRIYNDVGLYEEKVGTGMLPDGETDFLKANRDLYSVLKKKGYDVVYREYPEGHTWGNWRTHLIDALIHFFPGKNHEN